MSVPKQVVLQDDDEFEDFPIQASHATEKSKQWQDTWEDEDQTEDFSKQLEKQHLESSKMKL